MLEFGSEIEDRREYLGSDISMSPKIISRLKF